jgi:hypothetical protein
MDAENVDKFYADMGDDFIAEEGVVPTPEVVKSLELVSAVEEFEEHRRSLSFSGRHPELGKMIKCDGCGRRHRSSIIHERKFATDIHGEPCEPRIAEPKRFRQAANRYGWRTRPNPLILLMIDKARKAGLVK